MRRWSNTYLLIYLFNTLTYFTGFVCVDRPGFPLMAPRSKGFFFVKFVFTVVARCFEKKIVKKIIKEMNPTRAEPFTRQCSIQNRPRAASSRFASIGQVSRLISNGIFFFSFLFFVLPLILPLMAPRSKGFVSSSFLLLLLLLICSRSLLWREKLF